MKILVYILLLIIWVAFVLMIFGCSRSLSPEVNLTKPGGIYVGCDCTCDTVKIAL